MNKHRASISLFFVFVVSLNLLVENCSPFKELPVISGNQQRVFHVNLINPFIKGLMSLIFFNLRLDSKSVSFGPCYSFAEQSSSLVTSPKGFALCTPFRRRRQDFVPSHVLVLLF